MSLRITRRAADRLRAGHLWVYRTDLEPAQPEPEPGALVTLTDARNAPLGTALYSSASQIAARLISRQPDLTRDQYLTGLRTRIEQALQRRRELGLIETRLFSEYTREILNETRAARMGGFGLFAPTSNAQRLIFSEADNLPGIIVDHYNALVIVQLLTQGTAQDDVRRVLVDTLREFAPKETPLTIWERPDPRIRELEQLAPPPAEALYSNVSAVSEDENVPLSANPTTSTFTLNNLHFLYDVTAGQKTGAFLDQRLNYQAAASHVAASPRAKSGRPLRGLDICTYHGGFALHLARTCTRVTGVDQSRSALEAAEHNLSLNPSLQGRVDWIEADAFDFLRALDDAARDPATATTDPELGAFFAEAEDPAHPFDAIVLDPPAFAKSKRAAEGALRGYKELNLRALRLIAPGGTLITCSCSHHVSLEDFTGAVASAAADAGRRVQLLEIRAAAPDHPEVLTLPETRYLKCLICRVD